MHYIEAIVVDRAYRDIGIEPDLLRGAMAVLSEREKEADGSHSTAQGIYAQVAQTNIAELELYISAGFIFWGIAG